MACNAVLVAAGYSFSVCNNCVKAVRVRGVDPGLLQDPLKKSDHPGRLRKGHYQDVGTKQPPWGAVAPYTCCMEPASGQSMGLVVEVVVRIGDKEKNLSDETLHGQLEQIA